MYSAYSPGTGASVAGVIGRKHKRRAALFAAVASAFYGGLTHADSYYLQPTFHITPVDWNSTLDSYFTWRDTTTNTNVDIPGNGAIIDATQYGASGTANTTVNFNYAYTGTNAISALYIDNGNAISQTSTTSLMNTTSDIQVGFTSPSGGGGQYGQSAGTTTIGGWLNIGVGAGSTGTYNLSGGTLNVNTGIEEVGNSGVGVFNHTGGVNNASTLVVGNNLVSGARGTYNMSNGATVNVSQNLSVGDSGIGNFNMTGGTINIATNGTLGLVIGDYAGSSGTFTISGGTLSVPEANIYSNTPAIRVGNSGSGQMVQTGGIVNAGYLYVGFNAGSTGSYVLSGGTLNANLQAVEIGGFTQSGGTDNVIDLSVGYGTGVATFNLTGGTLTQGGNNAYYVDEFIGGAGSAIFSQSGGTHQVTSSNLLIGGYYYGTGSGTYTLSNGLLQLTNGENEGIGDGAGSFGMFNQSGGTQIVAGAINVAYNDQYFATSNGNGVFNLSGGTLIAGTINVNVNGLFNQTGGSLYATTFNLNGGSVTGSLQNTGTFNYLSGNFAGRLINQGVVNLGISFTAGNGIENDATMTVTNGASVYANGAGFDNLGTLNLQIGGTLGGTGPLINDYGGVMNAAGTLSGTFTNDGQLNVTGLLADVTTLTNNGAIAIPATDNLRSGGLANNGSINLSGGSLSGTGSVSNNPGGTVQGAGAVASLNNNGGLVYANGTGTLTITSLNGNSNGGEMRVANNSTLNVTNSFNNNAVITLQGSNAALNGGFLINLGTIQGAGRISNTILNSGVIRASGGQLTLSASGFQSNGGAELQASSGNTISVPQGITNGGTIALTGGTIDTGNANLTNLGLLLGNGTVTTGNLLNSGTITLSDAPSFVYGSLTNTGNVNLTSATVTFFGFFNNASGTVKTTAAVARYLAGASIGGTYHSDPSTNTFTDLSVTPTGALIGGAGDQYVVSGNYTNASTNAANWNTSAALLHINGGGTHTVSTTGAGGPTFAWGQFLVDSGNTAVMSGAGGFYAGATTNSGAIQQNSDYSNLGVLTGGGSLTVGGAATGRVDVTSFNQPSVTINTGSQLQVVANITGPYTNTATSLTINGNGSLNLNNNYLLTTTSTSTIRSYLKTGYNGGAWNGSTSAAIISTSANLSSGSSTRSLGYASSTDSVAGSVVIPAGQTLVKYTTPGDADLSGNTDFNDFLALQNAYNKPGDWSQGDFDYTGTVDFNDFLILQNNYNHSLNANGTVAGGSAKSALAKTSSLTASPSVPTATVTYVLSPNDDGHGNNAPGKFAVYAIDSTADGNHGMASFSVDVQGATLVTNFAPKGTYDDGTNTGNTVAEGFTLLRTGNGAFSTLTDPAKSSQDTVDASGVQLIYGMGQLAGNLNSQAPAGSSGGTGKVQPTYAAELLVMTGTFSGSSLAFNTDMTFDKANVFLTGSTADTEAAGITLTTGVPEPTTLSLMALAVGGLLGRRKRRH